MTRDFSRQYISQQSISAFKHVSDLCNLLHAAAGGR